MKISKLLLIISTLLLPINLKSAEVNLEIEDENGEPITSKNIDNVDKNGNTALIRAAKNLDANEIRILLMAGANPLRVNNDLKDSLFYLTREFVDKNNLKQLITDSINDHKTAFTRVDLWYSHLKDK